MYIERECDYIYEPICGKMFTIYLYFYTLVQYAKLAFTRRNKINHRKHKKDKNLRVTVYIYI